MQSVVHEKRFRWHLDRHAASENASETDPAKLLAVFVVDTDEKELTTPSEK
jgi:hypothetical protein